MSCYGVVSISHFPKLGGFGLRDIWEQSGPPPPVHSQELQFIKTDSPSGLRHTGTTFYLIQQRRILYIDDYGTATR